MSDVEVNKYSDNACDISRKAVFIAPSCPLFSPLSPIYRHFFQDEPGFYNKKNSLYKNPDTFFVSKHKSKLEV